MHGHTDIFCLTDDEEDYEDSGGNRLLGFMFGNVDDSGDLDVDYLDEVFLSCLFLSASQNLCLLGSHIYLHGMASHVKTKSCMLGIQQYRRDNFFGVLKMLQK